MTVIWSDEAIEDYHRNIDYLLKQWSTEVAIEFIDDVDTTIELIGNMPELYPLSDYKAIRRAVFRKQITLFYKVKESELHLLRFWNNHQNPNKLETQINWQSKTRTPARLSLGMC